MPQDQRQPERVADEDRTLAEIREELRGVRFGDVTLVVNDGRVTEIRTTKKKRL